MLSSKVKNTQTAEAPQAVKPPGQKGLSCLTKMHNHHCLMAHGPISSKHLPSLSHGTWPLLLQTPAIVVSWPLLLQTPTIIVSWHVAPSPPNTHHRCLMARGPFSSKHLPSSPQRSALPCSACSIILCIILCIITFVSWHVAPSPPNTYHRPLTGQLLPVLHAAPRCNANADDTPIRCQAIVPDCLPHMLHHPCIGPSSDDPRSCQAVNK